MDDSSESSRSASPRHDASRATTNSTSSSPSRNMRPTRSSRFTLTPRRSRISPPSRRRWKLGDLGADAAQSDVPLTERLDHGGVELLAGLGCDLANRLTPWALAAVRPVARDRIKRVGHGEHACTERDVVAGKGVGIATAVPAFVV